jgi:hypothetical protein
MYADLYCDAITVALLAQAAQRAALLKAADPAAALSECAASAIEELFCSCVSARDTCTCRTQTHIVDGLVDEVVRLTGQQHGNLG